MLCKLLFHSIQYNKCLLNVKMSLKYCADCYFIVYNKTNVTQANMNHAPIIIVTDTIV